MTGFRDSASFSSIAHRATTPPVTGATELAGLGSHLHSSPPEIRVHEDGDDQSQSRSINGLAFDLNAQLKDKNPFNNGEGSSMQPTDVKRSRKTRSSRRPRSDSLFPYSNSDNGSSTCADSSSSDSEAETESEDDGVVTPLTRRCSFVSEDPLVVNNEHHDGSASDSTPVYSDDSSEESDSDSSRRYTNLEMPSIQIPSLSRGTSVVSDGGEQNHLELRHPSDINPEPERPAPSKIRGLRSQRNALQSKIYGTMVAARSDDASLPPQRFFPKDQLCNVINTSTVFTELAKYLQPDYSREEIQGYADTICTITPCYVGGKIRRISYRSIFVILVLAERLDFIVSFIQEQVSDLDLPLIPEKESGSMVGMRRRRLNPDGTLQPLLRCFDDEEGWSPSSREQFDRYQWCMLAPFFSQGKHGQINHYPLHDQHILPFVLTEHQAEDDGAESQGGYGRVIMVRIHPAHHKLSRKTSHDRGFAVKQLLVNDRKSFKREREILKKFSGANSHRHIVSLLATYRHRNKYHFIFDRAQSDLSKFWNNHVRCPQLGHSDVIWIAEQCHGIAKGLFQIHRHKTFRKRCVNRAEDRADENRGKGQVTFVDNAKGPASDSHLVNNEDISLQAATDLDRTYSSDNELPDHYEIRYGRHGDINPQNILWFTDDANEPRDTSGNLQGTLKIADFGTAEMNSRWSKTGDRDVANTMTYRPPECDAADRTIRQSFDIWCLGCVFLEFVTWTLGGSRLILKFALMRTERDPYTKDETDTYFELVWNKSTRKTEARIKRSVFQFVEELHSKPRCTEFLHKLLNLVMHDMLIVDSQKRLSCREICRELKRLRKECEKEAYAMGPSRWCNGEHVTPEILLRSSEVKLSKEAQRQIARNLPLKVMTDAT